MTSPSDSHQGRTAALALLRDQVEELIRQADAIDEYAVSAHLCHALDRLTARLNDADGTQA